MIENLFVKHFRLLDGLPASFRRDFHEQVPWNERMTGITGARGVGKTTLILQHISKQKPVGKSHLYVSLDDIAFPFKNLVALAEDFEKQGGRFLYIDEIHKYRNWSQELKNIYDQFPSLKVVFTGSSMLDIAKGKADTLHTQYLTLIISYRDFMAIGYPISKISC